LSNIENSDTLIRQRQFQNRIAGEAFMNPITANAKNLKRADLTFWAMGIGVLVIAVATVFLSKDGKILPPKRETIVFAQWWENSMETGTLAEIIADFERENPLVTVRLHDAGWEDIRDGLFDASREPPDVIAVDTGRLAEVGASSLLETIPPMEGDAVAANAAATTSLRRYYLSIVSFLHPLYYNIDILTAAGYVRPPRTREEFLDYARKVTDTAKGVYGTALSRNVWTDIFPWVWAGGTGAAIETIDWTGRPAIATLSFLSTLNKEHLIYPSPFAKREDELLDAFLAGNIAMFVSSQASAAEIRARKPDLPFGVTTIPTAEQSEGRHVFPVSEWALAIPAKSPRQDAALTLLRYLAARKNDLAAAAHGITDYRYDPASIAIENPIAQKLRALYEASDTAAVSSLGPGAENMMTETRGSILALFEATKNEAETAAEIQAAFIREGALR
jgi:multiple sugar transport system substrate-binding protein